MIFNVGAGGASNAENIKYGDSNVGVTLDNLNESVNNLDNSVEFGTEEDTFLAVEDAIDFLVRDEEEAIAGYEKVEDAIEDFDVENKKEILDTIDHIKEEEEEHIEELTNHHFLMKYNYACSTFTVTSAVTF